MFWFVAANMVCATTELADLRIQTLLGASFMSQNFPWKHSNPHRHLNGELYFVNSGQCIARCGEQDYICNGADILLIPPGTQHTILQMSQNTDLHSFFYSFSPANKQDAPLYSRLLSRLSSPVFLRGQENLLLLLNQLRQECARKQPLYDTTVNALLQLFYVQLLRGLLDIPVSDLPQLFPIAPPITEPHRLCDTMPQIFHTAILDSFFNNSPLQKASLEELSRHLLVSVSQTRRMVKTHYGISFQEKLVQAKLERSLFLMSNPDLSLKAVAEQAGYGSYNAFFEAFTARTGQTPSQYRQTCVKSRPPAGKSAISTF